MYLLKSKKKYFFLFLIFENKKARLNENSPKSSFEQVKK